MTVNHCRRCSECIGEDLLTESGARASFDRGRNITNPCTFCGTPANPTHELRHIGRYPNGNLLTRPVCENCLAIGDALQGQLKPPPEPRPIAATPDEQCGVVIREGARTTWCILKIGHQGGHW